MITGPVEVEDPEGKTSGDVTEAPENETSRDVGEQEQAMEADPVGTSNSPFYNT